ncbi:hypothetical protein [Neobacillus sp. PS3-40]|uniref:hypothetical protein n=1 Tax=Neobacillus sp. PS3-40 TaxID=3070679 RepID=UPI0027E17589|nr:hypothetical protein [Neobacillus sp. PS3-40]WML44952.1 hypothetical protein RCG20_03325 [Neobacillus sp. PS3-40]
MKVFETIISILEDKGPMPIPAICTEVNRMLITYREKPFLPSQIKSIVSRKKDLFRIQEGNISIQPDKHPFLLVAILDGDDGISYQVNVNFVQKRFTFFEWRRIGDSKSNSDFPPKNPGDLDEFKREIFTMKLWEWMPSYGKEEGITLGKTNWMIKFKTKSKTYVCEGTDCFPKNWGKFCKAVEKLTGSTFR